MAEDSPNQVEVLAPPLPAPPERQRKNRAADAAKVLAMISSRFNDSEFQRKIRLARMVEDAFDRIPPDSEDELEADGLAWCANVDWGGMAAGISDGVEQDYNLATQPETYVRLVASARQPGRVVEPVRELERLDKEMLDDWSEFLPELEMMIHNRRALGLGVMHFPKPNSWHFKSLHPCNLVLPKRAKLNPETWAWCALKTEFDIVELLGRLADRQVSTSAGWQLAAVEKTIEEFAQNGGREWVASIRDDPEGFIYDLQTNDLWFGQENGTAIEGWIFYVKEWDGRVSEHLLVNKDDIGFIYSGVGRHASMADLLALFPLSLGQGHMERIRGYGMQMLPFHDLENQVMNHSVDVTMMASGLILKGGGDDFKRLREEVHVNGPFMALPGDLELAQQSFGNPTAGLIGLRREFERLANFRNRSFGGAEYGQRQADESATGARLRWQEANTSRTYEIARFYKQLGNFHRIRVSRYLFGSMTERDPGGAAVRALFEEAARAGVTLEDVKSIRRVVARTVFGDGDPINQFLSLMDLKEFFPRLPASGQRLFVRMAFVARLRDNELATELTGPADSGLDRELSFQQWHARIENDVFEGSDTRVDPMENDNHLIHAGEHTIYAEEVVARLREGQMSEEDALPRLMRADAHTRPHLAALLSDPFAQLEAKDLTRRWADLQNVIRQLSQQLAEKRERQQAEQLEELRNPQPTVKERETIMTEQMKRAAVMEEAQMRMRQMAELHALKMRMLKSGQLSKQQVDFLNSMGGGNEQQ